MVWYLNGSANDTLLHPYHINFVVNSHIKDPGQSVINDEFTSISLRNEMV